MLVSEARYALSLRALPPRVAWFVLRARRVAVRTNDEFTIASATRPRDLATLLALARGRRYIVELGTATAWTAIALALDDRRRVVATYDPVDHPQRRRYLALTGDRVRDRIEFVRAEGSAGPRSNALVELLYIDSSHDRDQTIAEVNAWSDALTSNALIVFDDYTHPEYPGVRAAIEQLQLSGEQRGTLFVAQRRASVG